MQRDWLARPAELPRSRETYHRRASRDDLRAIGQRPVSPHPRSGGGCPVHGLAYRLPQDHARVLIGPKMYPAVDACVGDVVGDLLERGVLQHDVWPRRVGQGDRMSAFAVKTFEHLGRRIGSTAVIRWITREARRHDERCIVGIGIGFSIAVRVTGADGGFGPPEVVVILVEERCDQAVADRHVDQREGAGVVGQRASLQLSDLLGRLIEHLGRGGGRVKVCDIRAIRRPLRAADVTDVQDFVVRLGVCVARERRRRIQQKCTDARNTEGRDVLPLKGDPGCDAVDYRAARGRLPFSRNPRARCLELRRGRPVVGAKSDHRERCGVTDGDAVKLGLTVCYRGQRVRARRAECECAG